MKTTAKYLVVMLSTLITAGSSAQMIEYVEDPYALQAPQELASGVDAVAAKIGFTKNYEVVVPKKPGLQVNPWNRFIACGTNPATKNWFILINPAWFTSLSKPEQEFLIGRCFMVETQGTNPWSMKLVQIFFFFLGLLLLFVFFKLLSRTRFAQQRTAVRILIACALLLPIEFLILNKFENKLLVYYAEQHNTGIHEAVIEKMGDRSAAIKALEALDAGVKGELAHGETILAPHKDLFATQAQALQR